MFLELRTDGKIKKVVVEFFDNGEVSTETVSTSFNPEIEKPKKAVKKIIKNQQTEDDEDSGESDNDGLLYDRMASKPALLRPSVKDVAIEVPDISSDREVSVDPEFANISF